MSAIRWEDSMSVGVSDLDVDHRRLLEILAQLQQSMGGSGNREFVKATIETLLTYTEEHFAHEEEAMERWAFPEKEAHEAEHQELMRKLVAFRDNAARGQVASTIELMDFLGGYLTNHMLGADKRLGHFLRERLGEQA